MAFPCEVLLGTVTDLARYNCQQLYLYKFYLTTCTWPLTFELRTLFGKAENPNFKSVSIHLVYLYVKQPVSCHFHSAWLNKCLIHYRHFFSKLPIRDKQAQKFVLEMLVLNFKVCKSMHHHTIQINQATRCKIFSSLLFDVYVQLNMFRASSRPSSGAQQLQ
jgi:hypothetical protein